MRDQSDLTHLQVRTDLIQLFGTEKMNITLT